jgi:ATP-dependent Clp protease ATP-binding subunit ClpX
LARKDIHNHYLICSFCGKGQREVRKLIAGPTVYICDECIRLCSDIIADQTGDKKIGFQKMLKLPRPSEMKVFLDQYVIGQHRAKKALAVAVYNHYKRIGLMANSTSDESLPASSPEEYPDVEIQKSNILVCGPTGTGKTLLATTLARMLNVPFVIADATSLTEAGYVGEDVESIVTNLLIAADYDIERAQRGIIYVDEIDKIARRGQGLHSSRDVSGEGVQQALLKIIEGTLTHIPLRSSRKYGPGDTIEFDTRNVLVICGGSFSGLSEIVQLRLKKSSIGFSCQKDSSQVNSYNESMSQLTPEDLTKFGLIPEFIGRLPVIVTLDELTEEDMVSILTRPKNALVKQYQKLLRMDNIRLDFDEEAIQAVAKLALENKSGARGLRNILENIMLDLLYELPSLKEIISCHIHKDVIEKQAQIDICFKTQKSA